MSNLGFHSLFDRTASFHGISAVRFFIERNRTIFSPDAFIHERKSAFTSQFKNLKGFDVILFTVSFELDYINIIRMLLYSSIPAFCTDRGQRSPIIIVGGIAVTANPMPASVFSDVVFVGDMESGLEEILEILMEHGFRKSEHLFEELLQIEGVYAYMFSKCKAVAKRRITKDIKEPAHSVVLTKNTEFSNMFLIEIVRGCRNSCTFCMTRCVAAPVRTIKKERIIRNVKRVLPFTSRVGLIAPVITDHNDLPDIINAINDMGFIISFSSLRADDFNEEMAGFLKANKQKTVTFAPETGSFGLRKRIGKKFTDEMLLHAVSLAMDYGIKRFRYYIMYGLPDESIGDIYDIARLVKKTLKLFKRKDYRLHLSINPFIPKKGTPLEGEKIYPLDYYAGAQKILKEELGELPGLSLRFESLRLLHVHYHLSTGNREIGHLLYGCLMKGSMKQFKYIGSGVKDK